MSTAFGAIAIKFNTDSHYAQRMKPNDFGFIKISSSTASRSEFLLVH